MLNRYAIYYTPPPGDLARLGAAWLGWDVTRGIPVAHPTVAVDIAKATERPRKYGLHGTVKAPFFLADCKSETKLADALAAFCAGQNRVQLDGLALSQIGRFLALTPVGDAGTLTNLAANTVRALDGFRAPMSDAEFARKNRPQLSPQQRQYLQDWGYPHVLEHFRFHITLTGPLADSDQQPVRDAVLDYLGDAIPQPFVVDSLTLCADDAEGQFAEVARFALGKASNSL